MFLEFSERGYLKLMPRKITTASDIEGLFIYHDKRNRTVYCGPFSKAGYVISNQLVGKYTFYSSKFVVALSVGLIAAYLFEWQGIIGLIAGVIAYVAMAFLFYLRFLPQCARIENFVKPAKENYIERNGKAERLLSNATTALLAIALPIVIIINMNQVGYTGIMRTLNILFAIGAALFALLACYLTIVSFIKAQEEKKKRR